MEFRLHHCLSKFDWFVFLNAKPISYFLGIYMACFALSRIYWCFLDHDLMASIWEKAISILAGNLNSGRSYLITTAASKVNLLFNSLLGRRRHYGYITILSVSVVTGTRLHSIYLLLPTKWQQWYWSISRAVEGSENTRRGGSLEGEGCFDIIPAIIRGMGGDCPPSSDGPAE